ncbi:pyridine nucleotide-disulfide oxidoreductase [Anaerosporomusa subterranea]|uniref:Pyridine nucleotide-disulfide oxidoreductase n=1 Tax=Anaerosporomusa subterranea TaxID=1794912 RepID=A0A154BM03_ANASB|nr:FAD-dependent oxidoreductase [Anaerosporomusa subterranea]KYZ74945.1 pyridine nucleotide-disulfide oxidoreductase [Anaerosporomusa subterranea]
MKKILVIGGVAAGLKAAAKARRCDSQASITVLERGKIISYGACGMPYYVGGDVNDIDDLMKTPVGVLRSPGYFKNAKDITVLTQTEAMAIDRDSKVVTVKNLATGEDDTLPYDKLVIATGASAIKPSLPGVELGNIYSLWHPDDAKAIRQGIEAGKFNRAIIIGAGLVGMEMAEALTKQQLQVTVVEMKDQVFPAFLDPEIAGVVSKYAAEKGINLLAAEKVEAFIGETEVTAVKTDKRTIPADLVVLAIGARPNVELARAAGLTIGTTGAISVDDEMRTSDPDIYAGGDCVENINIMSGQKVFAPMGSTANKHGRVIGENLCGGHVKFKGVLNTVIAKVHSLTVGKTGLSERDAKQLGYDYITVMVAGPDKPHYMGAKSITIKLIADANTRKVLGMQAVGEGEVAKRVDVAAAVLTMGGTIDDLFDIDLSYAPPYNSPIDNLAVAANAVMNKLAGKFNGISPITAKEKMQTGKAVFLDVRTPDECKQIRLADCPNIKYIPLGQLRSRLAELNKADEIVAFCKISLRGYEAEGFLEGAGFENVKVLEGGIVSWPFACEKEE